MLILMCGLPKSGKSVVAAQLADILDALLLNPEEFVPPEVLNTDREADFRIESWSRTIDLATQAVGEHDNIVLDCGNSKSRTLYSLMQAARRFGHRVILVFVNCPIASCQTRTTLHGDVYKKYVESLKVSLPEYKESCDRIIKINNSGTLDDLVAIATSTATDLATVTF